MSKKVQLSDFERQILWIGAATAVELESAQRLIKVRLSQIKPKGATGKSKAKPELREEKAS